MNLEARHGSQAKQRFPHDQGQDTTDCVSSEAYHRAMKRGRREMRRQQLQGQRHAWGGAQRTEQPGAAGGVVPGEGVAVRRRVPE